MPLRTVPAHLIAKNFREVISEIFCQCHTPTLTLLRSAHSSETDELARDMLESILQNAEIAAREQVPLCQDTGLVIVFAQMGTEVHIEGGTLQDILDSAAYDIWQELYLRDSLSPDPLLLRHNPTAEHTRLPVVLHLEQVPGDRLTLRIALKGGGAENMSALRMFNPTITPDEIDEFIVSTVVNAGGNPCPPVIVGVGIGGDFELCAILAKKALLLGSQAEQPYAQMEQRILASINQRGKGVQGFTGHTTALSVHIRTAPCHIASLPVAVNLDCHAHRYAVREL